MPVVEFLGAPGSGKSSIARRLVELTGATDLNGAVLASIRSHGSDPLAKAMARVARSSQNRIWRRSYDRSTDRFSALHRFFAAHPQTVETFLTIQRERRDRDLRAETMSEWVLNFYARYQLATEHRMPHEWLVIDEGFCQRGAGLLGPGFTDSDVPFVDRYLRSVPLPDVVVVVETPLQVCESRLDERGWSQRLAGLGRDERRAFLGGMFDSVASIATELAYRDSTLIRVIGTAPLDEVSNSVAATLAM